VSFVRGLLAGRSHLAVLLGLAAAAATVGAVHRFVPDEAGPISFAVLDGRADDLPLRAPGPLSAEERALARAAFAWVARNTDPRTGLASAVAGQHAATLWDAGSQLLALVAAEDLALLGRREARARLARALRSLGALPLGEGGLPNKAYDVRTLGMVAVDGTPVARDVGWSALDVARALLPLAIVARRHPDLAPLAVAAVARWRLDALSDGRTLRGATRRGDGALETYAEGRLGYEQHAAKALLAWGVPAPEALDWRAHLTLARVAGQLVPRDDRRPRDHGGAPAALVPEPWLLDALEHGPDAATLPVLRALLRAQARRDAAVGRLTAVSEDALDGPPWFSYSAIVNGDDTWVALGPDGTPAPGTLTFSTKAAVAWAALFEGAYPRRLLAAAAELVGPGDGLYAGRYDATGRVNRVLSLNTNAVVLEALAYRVRGPAVRASLAPPPPEAAP
jgi:uncharacterized protein DUF3131